MDLATAAVEDEEDEDEEDLSDLRADRARRLLLRALARGFRADLATIERRFSRDRDQSVSGTSLAPADLRVRELGLGMAMQTGRGCWRFCLGGSSVVVVGDGRRW